MASNKFLLDTHIFIWAMEKNKRLSEELKRLLTDPHNKIFISVASLWEILIKKTSDKKGKFIFDINDIEHSTKTAGFEVLSIQTQHVIGLLNLPLHHKDPFDRILISQAIVEKLTLITTDEKIGKYNLPLLKI